MFDETSLSPAGEARREQILQAARAEARRSRTRRRAVKAVSFTLTAALALGLLMRHHPTTPSQPSIVKTQSPLTRPTPPQIAVVPPAPVFKETPRVIISYLPTEHGLADRLAIPAQLPSWHQMNDDELLTQLAAAGHPAGLAWVDGREMLLLREMPIPSTVHRTGVQRVSPH